MAYKGKLGSRIMSGRPHLAYTSYRAQKYRCTNKNASDYKYYGFKGICVEYSSREYVSWWLRERVRFPHSAKVSIDRIDHSKNYTFSNIRMILHSDNVGECNRRTHFKGVDIYKDGAFLKNCNTAKEASEFCGVSAHIIHSSRRKGGRLSRKGGWSFKFPLDPIPSTNMLSHGKKE